MATEHVLVPLLRHEPEGDVEPGNADLQKLALTGWSSGMARIVSGHDPG
jgi:hypothetical protein